MLGFVRGSTVGALSWPLALLATFAILQGCADDAAVPSAGDPDSGAFAPPIGDDGGTNPTGDAGTEPSGPPAVRFVGRFDTTDAKGPKVGWPGARVIVRFKGTTLNAKIDETNLFSGPSGYDVIVDGNVQAKPFVPTEGTADHVIVKDLPVGTHVVELWRRTESYVGTTQFLGFDYGGGELLAPPVPPTRHIETVGDSSTSGYGIECTDQSQPYTGATANDRKTYGAITANALNAEHYNISYSGKGILRNYDSNDPVVFAQLYGRTLAEDATSKWSFTAWQPDVVVIALAGNDWDNTGGRPPPSLPAFKAKYHELVTLIRSKNPNAQILCTVAAAFNDDYPPLYKTYTNVTKTLKAIVDERHKAPFNDPKVHYHEFPRAQSDQPNGGPDLSGCDGHSNASHHAKLAVDLTAKIKSITGW
jgi:lysophospholipase L1-like esterase